LIRHSRILTSHNPVISPIGRNLYPH
jgi:hypothetical protein